MDGDLLSHKSIENYILTLPGAVLDYPFGEGTAVYKVQDKMFALIGEKKTPLNLSLKCDPLLSQTLQKKYESVIPGYHLNKKYWITIILSGQLEWDEIKDLINHSYSQVTSTSN